MKKKKPHEREKIDRTSVGRPIKLTRTIIKRAEAYVRAGSYIETAVLALGVSRPTFHNWLKLGQEVEEKVNSARKLGDECDLNIEETNLLRFLRSMQRAMAESEIYDVTKIRVASEKNWQAAAWRLERKYPDRWGRRDMVRTELTGADGGPVVTHEQESPFSVDHANRVVRGALRREVEEEFLGSLNDKQG